MPNTNLILLAYGSENEYKRAILCMFSFWAFSELDNAIRLIIFTDNPEYFDEYFKGRNVEFNRLTEDQLLAMLGKTDYIHRRKIAVINQVLQKYVSDNVVFVDSDTFFHTSTASFINGLIPGVSYMHKREYTFEHGLALFSSFNQPEHPLAFIRFIESTPVEISGQMQYISKHEYCWNSGVLGLTPDIATYMQDIFKLSDDFFNNSSWFISEQLAFSVVLSRKTKIYPSDKFVMHYWGRRQKKLMDRIIERQNLLTFKDKKPAAIRSFIKSCARAIKSDLIKEQAVNALSNKSWLYGIKKFLQALLIDPRNINVLSELLNRK